MSIDFPCECGHEKSLHKDGIFISGCRKRIGWGIKGTDWADDCKEYKSDNLKYLEQLYESRTGRT